MASSGRVAADADVESPHFSCGNAERELDCLDCIRAEQSLRPWQFRLGTLFVLVTIAGVALAFVVRLQAVNRLQTTLAALGALGATTYYEFQAEGFVERYVAFTDWEAPGTILDEPPDVGSQQPAEPHWLRNCLGVDFFHDVEAVALADDNAEAAIPYLQQLPRLKCVFVQGGGSCGMALASAGSAVYAIKQALPDVKVVLCWYTIPVVG